MNKVYGGTTREDTPDLCETCRRCTIIRGHSLQQVIKSCELRGLPVPFRVNTCKSYMHRSQLYPFEMEKIAWVLDLDKGKRVIGFMDPDKRRKREGADPNMPAPCPDYPGDPFK